MGSLVWPIAVQEQATLRVMLGRFLHWALAVAASALIAGGVIASGLVLAGRAMAGDPAQMDPAMLTLSASGLGVGLFFFGRSLRYLIARE